MLHCGATGRIALCDCLLQESNLAVQAGVNWLRPALTEGRRILMSESWRQALRKSVCATDVRI